MRWKTIFVVASLLWTLHAWALGPVNTTPKLTCGSGDENPIGASYPDFTNKIDSAETQGIRCLTGVWTDHSGGGQQSAWYNVSTFGPDAECFWTTTDHTGANGNYQACWIRLQDVGTTGPDGIYLQVTEQATDTIEVYEVTNNAYVLVGSAFNQEVANGDAVRLAGVSTTCTVEYHNGTSWSELGTRTCDNVTVAGFIGWQTNSTNLTGDNAGGGTLVPIVARRRMIRFE